MNKASAPGAVTIRTKENLSRGWRPDECSGEKKTGNPLPGAQKNWAERAHAEELQLVAKNLARDSWPERTHDAWARKAKIGEANQEQPAENEKQFALELTGRSSGTGSRVRMGTEPAARSRKDFRQRQTVSPSPESMEDEVGSRAQAGPVVTNKTKHCGEKTSTEEWRTGEIQTTHYVDEKRTRTVGIESWERTLKLTQIWAQPNKHDYTESAEVTFLPPHLIWTIIGSLLLYKIWNENRKWQGAPTL
jgi:hypothetical protein